jgi:hypothetical protein
MLIRLNMIMRRFREKGDYPMLFVVDRVGNRSDVVVLIVDIFTWEREHVEAAVKQILDHLSAYNIKVVDYKMTSYVVFSGDAFREVWRFAAMVAVDNLQ